MEGKSHRKALLAVSALYLVWQTGMQWTGTLLPFLQWSSNPPMTPAQVSYFQALGSVANVAGAAYLGSVLHVWGAKWAFGVAAVLTGAYYAVLSHAESLVALFMVQFLRCGYQFDLIAETYIATTTPESQRTSAMLSLGTPLALAMLSGPYLATITTSSLNIRLSQLLVGPLLVAFFLPLLKWHLPDTHAPPRKLSDARFSASQYVRLLAKHDHLVFVLCLRVALVGAHIAFELVSRQFLMRALVRVPGDSLGMLAAMGGSVLLCQVAVLPVLQSLRRPQALLGLAFAAVGLAYAGLPWVSTYAHLATLLGLQAGAFALAFAETSAQLSASVGKGEVGRAVAVASLLQWGAHTLVPLMVGQAVTRFHYRYVFHAASVVSFAAAGVVGLKGQRLNLHQLHVLPSLGAGHSD